METAPAALPRSPNPLLGPFSCTMKRSTAVMRPSSLNPMRILPWKPARADPIAYSSARLMRIMTGLPVLRAMCAGIDMTGYALPLDPNPPPQNSATKTRSDGSIPM